MLFQCGFIYGLLILAISKINPLDWHPVIYTLFFEYVLFVGYTSYRALTDDDDFKDIEDIFYNGKNN